MNISMVKIIRESSSDNILKRDCESILGMSISELLEDDRMEYLDLTEDNILAAYKKCKEVHTLVHSKAKIKYTGVGFGFIISDPETVNFIHDNVVDVWDIFDEDYGDYSEFCATFEEAGEYGSIGFAEDQAAKPYFSVTFGEL